jgi:3-deoxy-D-manno-octulosonic-acid transferase
VRHVYLPYDLPGAVRNFLDHFRPRVAVVMETEIWPNLFAELHARGIPLLVANARLSGRSLRGYRPIAPLVAAALAKVDVVAAQSQADAGRYRRLGAPPERVQVTGNIKYDLRVPVGIEGLALRWRAAWGAQRPVWIAASTHPDEEEAVRAAHAAVLRQHPGALLLWAPRHPERFAAVAGDAADAGFRVATRRRDTLPGPDTQLFVVDTLGELMAFFAAADIAFVGGSLQAIGGHNVLEPAALGVPALVGPHTFNFQEITALLVEAGAVQRVADAAALAAAVDKAFRDPAAAQAQGAAGRVRIAGERGALARTMDLLDPLLRG